MSTEQMPAAEAASYELAFHVLPTVAEGEVATVATAIKDAVAQAGGEVTSEEAPERVELAYDIIKYLEGRNRKFSSAYFGWMRFTLDPAQLAEVSEKIEGMSQLLRHLLIRLTKLEEENPFFYHEAMAAERGSETIDLDAEEGGEAETDAPAAEADEATEDAEDNSEDNSDDKESEVK